MRRIINSLLLVLHWPFQLLRKTKTNSFVGGLMFGAIFSLVINVLTIQIQEVINRQRALEALENEMVVNLVHANNIINKYERLFGSGEHINYFYYSTPYSTDFWSQSGESLRYISQIGGQTQAGLMVYNTYILRNANAAVARANSILILDYPSCFTEELFFMEDDARCLNLVNTILTFEKFAADLVLEYGEEVLDNFRPTKDRLNSTLLRFLLGTEAVGILSETPHYSP
jgi:hypothetical protein